MRRGHRVGPARDRVEQEAGREAQPRRDGRRHGEPQHPASEVGGAIAGTELLATWASSPAITISTFQLSGRSAAADMRPMSAASRSVKLARPGTNSSVVPSWRPTSAQSATRLLLRWRTGTARDRRGHRCGSPPKRRRTRARPPRCWCRAAVPSRRSRRRSPLVRCRVTHDRSPHGRVAHEEADVGNHPALDPLEVGPERRPVPDGRGGEGGERHALDPGQHVHQVVAPAVAQRRHREATVAADDGGDPVEGRRRQRRVPEDLHVVVGVQIDEPGAHDLTLGIDGASAGPLIRSPMAATRPSRIATSAPRPAHLCRRSACPLG